MLFLFSVTWGSVSGWWALAGLLAGLGYAWLLYRRPVYFTAPLRLGLAALRTITVALIILLLVSPLFKTITYQPQKPLILVAQDNSTSVNSYKPAGASPQQTVKQLATLQKQLGSDYEVHAFHFDQQLNDSFSSRFNGKRTDISTALQQLNERYANQNLGAVVLATDGLYNAGADPEAAAQQFKTTFYTVALGDTTIRRDALIGNLNYNRTAFLDNDFVIEVLAEAYQSKGQQLHLRIAEDGRPVYAQTLPVSSSAYHQTIPVKLNADRKGLHRFTVSLAPLPNEAATANNTATVYIEVLDARQKVLLVYNSPHPDVSAIKQAIEQNRNYEVKAVNVSQLATLRPTGYSLLVLHQLTLSSSPVLKQLAANAQLPVFYILGAQSNLEAFDAEQNVLQLTAGQANVQEVFAQPVTGFTAFTVSDSTLKKIGTFPPLLAPFGDYSAGSGTQLLLKQKIGSVATPYPLLLFGKSGNRNIAVLAGEGLWRWQLAGYETYGNHHAVEELLGQSVQYLTANANRERFRIYPAKTVFDESDEVILNAELYNEALELVNTPDISLAIKSSTGKLYSYQFSRNQNGYQLNAGALPAGDYSYSGRTKLGTATFTASGRFSVEALNMEDRQSTADHRLLERIAKVSGGQMLLPSQLSRLARLIKQNENIKTIEYQDLHYTDAIDTRWPLALIILLLSTEWLVRKREGEI